MLSPSGQQCPGHLTAGACGPSQGRGGSGPGQVCTLPLCHCSGLQGPSPDWWGSFPWERALCAPGHLLWAVCAQLTWVCDWAGMMLVMAGSSMPRLELVFPFGEGAFGLEL